MMSGNFMQIMLFSSEELQLFHAVAERRASAANLRLASLLIWGRPMKVQPDAFQELPLQAKALHDLGMSKLVNCLAKQLQEGAGKTMLDRAFSKLERITAEVT